MEPKVIFESSSFLVINKPAGLLVHDVPTKSSKLTAKSLTLVDWLLEHYPEVKTVGDDPITRPGIVHRLDKDTSGVMVVARTQEAFLYFKKLFQEHQIKKTYLAVVRGNVRDDTGIIDKPIGIKNGTTKRSVISKNPTSPRFRRARMAKEAVTEYRVLKRYTLDDSRYTLLEVFPKTGRTHQIRVHLASIGHSIVGDPLYSGRKSATRFALHAVRLMLHAKSLEFLSPEGERLKIETDPPVDFSIVP